MSYVAPVPADLKERYTAFASVADDTVQTWLDDAAAECPTWPASYRAKGEMALAAHRMVETGTLASAVPSGVTSFRSGSFSAQVDNTVAARTGYKATVYGREFARLRRLAFGPAISSAWTPPATTDA